MQYVSGVLLWYTGQRAFGRGSALQKSGSMMYAYHFRLSEAKCTLQVSTVDEIVDENTRMFCSQSDMFSNNNAVRRRKWHHRTAIFAPHMVFNGALWAGNVQLYTVLYARLYFQRMYNVFQCPHPVLVEDHFHISLSRRDFYIFPLRYQCLPTLPVVTSWFLHCAL